MQTILGSGGTIGTTLAGELMKYTDKVRLVSRNPRKVNDSDELFIADLTDPHMVDKAVSGSEVVYLTLGLNYNLKTWEENWPKIMKSTIEACIRHKSKLVFFDNVYMYDIGAIPHMTEHSPINPPSKKGLVRKHIAQMLLDAVKTGQLTALIARCADFYGPDTDKSFVTEVVIKNLKNGKSPNWFVNADKIHTFTYAPDAAKATALLGNTASAYNQVWHLPTDKNALTGREFIELFSSEMHTARSIFVLPQWMIKAIGIFIPVMKEMPEMLYQYDRDYFFDSSKFEKNFDFKITSYQEGVKQTVGQTVGADVLVPHR